MSSRIFTRVVATILLATLVLLACATTGPGGKQSLILIPTSQELTIGQGMAAQVDQTEKTLDDPEWQAYLTEVGNRIVAVSDRKDIEYRFRVIESSQVNAFAAPGGYVYFYTGLLKQMNSEAEMAAVMAHEISHVVARHGVKRLQAVLGIAAAYELAFGGEEQSELTNTAINLGMGLAFAGYSREHEREADQYGIHYMVKAGYNPNGAVDMFNTLARLGGSSGSDVFEQIASSHPETQERIANAKNQIAALGTLSTNLAWGKDRYQTMKARLP